MLTFDVMAVLLVLFHLVVVVALQPAPPEANPRRQGEVAAVPRSLQAVLPALRVGLGHTSLAANLDHELVEKGSAQ